MVGIARTIGFGGCALTDAGVFEKNTPTQHGRSRRTVDPRIPTMPGRSTSGFSPTRQILLAPSAYRREVLGESHEG